MPLHAIEADADDQSVGEEPSCSEAPAHGPAAAALPLEPVFTGVSKLANTVGTLVWLTSLVFFWAWWLRPEHVDSPTRFIVLTIVLLWVTLIPAYFIVIFARARIPNPQAAPPGNARIAIVVTKAPSEPFSVVSKTLEGALCQNGVRHDTWLADEDPDPETLKWCRQRGVLVSSRRDAKDYHRETWPRRTRCKEGNLAYFYDQFGYERYDFVSQFDADHVPSPDYLRHAVAPFSDPDVGYVSAPSICDSNADRSWSARGRLFVEASLHGALQAGYNAGLAPLCIGSHYVVRTAALRSIGGLGPELAEDHSTTLMFNAAGWKGVHAIDAIAHGEGPNTFSDLAVQEFQWSRSLVTILLEYTPSYVRKLPWRLKLQFLFSQLWYPAFSGFMALMYVMPIAALATGAPFANVTYIDHFRHILPMSATLLILAYWWRSTGMFRPADAPILSWEGLAFLLLRWPWALIGSASAVWSWLRGTHEGFRITPKGVVQGAPLGFRFIAPYMALSGASAAAAYLVTEPGTAAGFYIFNLVNAGIYWILVCLVVYRHARENSLSLSRAVAPVSATVAAMAIIAGTIVAAAHENGPRGLAAMNMGITAFTLTKTLYAPSGAGTGTPGAPIIILKPEWHGFSTERRTTNNE